jgi:alpha-1,3-glucosyltransferase
MSSHVWRLFIVATGLKLCLLPAYHSTDFEVHRGWMALTSKLPISRWYVDSPSEWTLDYPPFFAWFEWLLSLGAPLFDEGMLVVSAKPYVSPATVAYQRLTVIATDSLLVLGAYALAAASSPRPSGASRRPTGDRVAVWLTVLNAGLLLVDHVHFQYNGMLVGLLLLSCAALVSGRERLAAFGFATLLNLKHLFLFAAPLYFVQLLRDHVLAQRWPPSPPALRRLLGLASIVLAVFGVSVGPFLVSDGGGQFLGAIGARLFPFGRGLTHAYWAPNVWAVYTFADRVLAAAARKLRVGSGVAAAANSGGGSSGLVGETTMQLLPSVGAGHASALVLLAQAPLLLGTWRAPRRAAFAPAVAFCGLAAFLFGFHVHEKALLPPLLVLTALTPPRGSPAAATHARLLTLLSASAHYALLPLLHEPAEWALARLLPLAYHLALLTALRERLGTPTVGLVPWESAYLFGFVGLELFCSFAHPMLLAPRLPFLPLMATSVYCAVGVIQASRLSFRFWRESH